MRRSYRPNAHKTIKTNSADLDARTFAVRVEMKAGMRRMLFKTCNQRPLLISDLLQQKGLLRAASRATKRDYAKRCSKMLGPQRPPTPSICHRPRLYMDRAITRRQVADLPACIFTSDF
jgi:hypothetical protein